MTDSNCEYCCGAPKMRREVKDIYIDQVFDVLRIMVNKSDKEQHGIYININYCPTCGKDLVSLRNSRAKTF